jgi:Zn-dependent peptidase ImmA (M78 family)
LNVQVTFEEFPIDISGALFRGRDQVVIAANKTHHEHRQRFTIAHELGHYLLHPDSPAYYDREREIEMHFRARMAGTEWDPKETEANRFAAELLMPRRFLLQAISQGGDLDARSLSTLFEVSEQAMTYRLAELRLA